MLYRAYLAEAGFELTVIIWYYCLVMQNVINEMLLHQIPLVPKALKI
jgi:hypothetical protein